MADFIIDDEPISDALAFPRDVGYGLVPRDYSKYPEAMFAPPAEMPLIPRSEWSARIKEQEDRKSRLSDLRNFAALNQNPQPYCHTEDTEVLTERGWVAWPGYNGTDLLGTMNQATGFLEFQAPLARQVFEYKGETVHSTNRRIDFGVTPNHRMLVRKWDERRRTLADHFSFVQARDIGWYAGLPHATRGFIGTEIKRVAIDGDREYDGDDFIAMLGLVTSDGYAGGTENTKNWVSFASFREGSRHEIEPLAARLGFHECPSRRGVWIRYNAAALASWMRANCYTDPRLGAEYKHVPDLVKCVSMRQISHFLYYFDDRNRIARQFYSKSKRMVDDLQELHLRIGKRCHIGWHDAEESELANGQRIRNEGGYRLTVGEADRLCLDRKKHLTTDRYNGLVYCATVPNGTLVTRRNGSVLVSGNCWAYSTTSAVMLLRAANNQPAVRLSAHAIGCLVMNYRDEGGWCGLSAKFHRERGCPSVGLWTERSMNRNNDRPETWANAALHKVTEDWTDLTRQVYDQNLTFDQLATCLLSGIPCAVDFNWWSHSVCAMDLVEVEPGSFGIRILNSWGDEWGEFGTAILRGAKAIPNGAVALRVTGASEK